MDAKQAAVVSMALAISANVEAETVVHSMQARVHTVWNVEGSTEAQYAFAIGDRATITVVYETADGNPERPIHAMTEALVAFDNGFLARIVGGEIYVLDGDPGYWDYLWFFGNHDYAADILAPPVGDAWMRNLSLEFNDESRTALSSSALGPIPPLAAFTHPTARLAFVNADYTGATQVFAGIESLSGGIHPAHVCTGFAAAPVPGDTQTHRALVLRAALHDVAGQPLLPGDLPEAPTLRVTYFPAGSLDPIDVTELAAGPRPAGSAFTYRAGEWHYVLKGHALAEPGTYHVSMVSPDIRRYVIAPGCRTSVVVGAP